MTEVQLNIITKAVQIQIAQGIEVDQALKRYTKLSTSEKAVIKDRLSRS